MSQLERFTHGETDAFEHLFRQFQGQVFAWIVRIVRDRGVAEDLTIETFWRIYQARARFRPEGRLRRVGYRIATNLALNHLRRKRRKKSCLKTLRKPTRRTPPYSKRRAIAPFFGIAVYYLVWKYAVGFLNRVVGIEG